MDLNKNPTLKFNYNDTISKLFQDICCKILSAISDLAHDDTLNDFECLEIIDFLIDKCIVLLA